VASVRTGSSDVFIRTPKTVPTEVLEPAMPEIHADKIPPVDDFYDVLRKHIEAKHEPRLKTLRPIVAPF
jgi:hypothetical protein